MNVVLVKDPASKSHAPKTSQEDIKPPMDDAPITALDTLRPRRLRGVYTPTQHHPRWAPCITRLPIIADLP